MPSRRRSQRIRDGRRGAHLGCHRLSATTSPGHAFYVLVFPTADKTWVYDITTGHWHQWMWLDTNGDEHRHRANCYALVAGVPVVGDWQKMGTSSRST